MTTFMLVPGACHGGWWYRPVADYLRALGHEVYPVTYTGVGDRAHLLTATVNLDTHILDVSSLLLNELLTDVVLVGHSYGGCVITGVADQLTARIRALLYLDAFVPDHGDSCWSMANADTRQWYVEGSAATGIGVQPLPTYDPRATAHPLAAFMQAARLTGAWKSVRRKHYAAATAWQDESPFTPTAARLRAEPGWVVRDVPVRHGFAEIPVAELAQLMIDAAGRDTRPVRQRASGHYAISLGSGAAVDGGGDG